MSEPSREPVPASQVRIGDAEREEALEILSRAHAEGRIDLDELDERSGAVVQARTRGDLDALTADLPRITETPAVLRPDGPERRTLPNVVRTAVGVVVICNLVWLFTSLAGGFVNYWPMWPTLGMAIWVFLTYQRQQGSR